jgi:hypothetical protein
VLSTRWELMILGGQVSQPLPFPPRRRRGQAPLATNLQDGLSARDFRLAGYDVSGIAAIVRHRAGFQCRCTRTRSLSKIITSPSAAAIDVAKKSCQLCSWGSPAGQPSVECHQDERCG